MVERRYSVYIVASRRNGTLYSFTARYGVKTLVWHEHYSDVR
jgi:predicted GIY-YIG superfamily endonuclease